MSSMQVAMTAERQADCTNGTVEGLQLVAAGELGINEMQKCIDDGDDSIMWALVNVMVGSGSLRRSRTIFLHINGINCPLTGPKSKTRINEYTNDARTMMGALHLPEIRAERKTDITVSNVLERMKKFIVQDSAEFSLDWIVKDYEDRLHQKRELIMKERAGSTTAPLTFLIPSHDSGTTFENGRAALKSATTGPQNWIFWTSAPAPRNMQVVGGGLGCVSEMSEFLSMHQNKVMFGLIRMEFGDGRLKREKFVFVHAVGENFGVEAKAKSREDMPKMKRLAEEFAQISVEMQVKDPCELTDKEVVQQVLKASIIDKDSVAGDTGLREMCTVEYFRETVRRKREDAVQAEIMNGAESRTTSSLVESTWEEVVKLVHNEGGPDWAVFKAGPAWLERRMLPTRIGNGKLKPASTGGYQASKCCPAASWLATQLCGQ